MWAKILDEKVQPKSTPKHPSNRTLVDQLYTICTQRSIIMKFAGVELKISLRHAIGLSRQPSGLYLLMIL